MNVENRTDNIDYKKVTAFLYAESVKRCIWFSFLMAGLCIVYSFTSLSFISYFKPTISLWDNFWPRLLTGSLPSLAIAFYLLRGKSNNSKKSLFALFIFPVLFHLQAWIHVWPISLAGKPEILAYVDGPNVYLLALLFMMVAPPKKQKLIFTFWLLFVFVLPLLAIAFVGKNKTIFSLILNDTLIAFSGSFILSSLLDKLREKVARLELERSEFAKGFLGDQLSKAIYEDRKDLLERREVLGIVSAIDIRGYTNLAQSNDKKHFSGFMDEYFEILNKTVKKFGGYIHKTSGDGHLISFGLFDHNPDLSEILSSNHELMLAEKRRLHDLANQSVECLESIIKQGQILFSKSTLNGCFRLGASIDTGPIEIKVTGDNQSRKELDIFGLTVIRSARLEAHTKAIADHFEATDSLIILSESTVEHIENHSIFIVDVSDKPVRDFPDVKKIGVIAKPIPGLKTFHNIKIAA